MTKDEKKALRVLLAACAAASDNVTQHDVRIATVGISPSYQATMPAYVLKGLLEKLDG